MYSAQSVLHNFSVKLRLNLISNKHTLVGFLPFNYKAYSRVQGNYEGIAVERRHQRKICIGAFRKFHYPRNSFKWKGLERESSVYGIISILDGFCRHDEAFEVAMSIF